MSNLTMALCFLDEQGDIIAKKDLDISWDLENAKSMGKLESVLIMDAISGPLIYKVKEEVDRGAVVELLNEVQRNVK